MLGKLTTSAIDASPVAKNGEANRPPKNLKIHKQDIFGLNAVGI